MRNIEVQTDGNEDHNLIIITNHDDETIELAIEELNSENPDWTPYDLHKHLSFLKQYDSIEPAKVFIFTKFDLEYLEV
jgi:hypothetical protein